MLDFLRKNSSENTFIKTEKVLNDDRAFKVSVSLDGNTREFGILAMRTTKSDIKENKSQVSFAR